MLHEPKATSTQQSQLLYGHCAEILSIDGAWTRVRSADGYEGWTHNGYLDLDATGCDDWGWETGYDLSLGCTLRTSSREIDLPLGAVVREGDVVAGERSAAGSRRETFPSESTAILTSARRFFRGTWYQWGGVTPWGADCSGMVQSLFSLHGVRLLRDSWQQATQGVLVEGGLGALHPGDLLFFSDRADGHITHVALAAADRRFVHLAIGRGGWADESLDDEGEYIRGLISRFRFARRILSG